MSQKGFTNTVLIVLVVVLASALGYITLIKKPASTEQPQSNNSQNTQPTTPTSPSPQLVLDCSSDDKKIRFLDSSAKFQGNHSVISFNNYDVPTCNPTESQIYLPVWQQVFQKVNSINDDYFNSHISVTAAWVDEFELEGKSEKRFSLTYDYQIDWAKVRLTDTFTYSFKGIEEGITAEELLRDANLPTSQTKFKRIISMQKLKPVSRIASKEQIQSAVKSASPVLRFDANQDIFVDRDGNLTMRVGGVIDHKTNRCLSGIVILETAELKGVGETSCVIY